MPHDIRIGNSRADAWADHAADIASVFRRTPKPYGLIDAMGWKVRKRLLAVCMDYIQKSKVQKEPPPPIPSKMQTLENLGHIIVEGHNRLECIVCGSFWPSRMNMQTLSSSTECIGIPPAFDCPISRDTEIVRIRTSNLAINGREVHPSHCLAWKRGVLFCSVCGYHAVKKIVRLHDRCRLKVPNEAIRRHLNGIYLGKSPTSSGRWPQEEGSAPPRAWAKFLTLQELDTE